MTDFLAYSVVRVLVAIIQTLPFDMGNTLCLGLARLAAGPLKIRRRVTQENLNKIFPDADEAEKETARSADVAQPFLWFVKLSVAQRRLHLVNWRKTRTHRSK